jgi:hypothetical protein
MTDRPVRPLWPKGYRNEVQCVATVFSADMVTAHDILCINAVSAALTISPLPFLGPIGAVRMAIVEGDLVINPTLEEADGADLDLIVVGTKDGLTMVEAGANQVPEASCSRREIAHRGREAVPHTAPREAGSDGSTRRPSGSKARTATGSGRASPAGPPRGLAIVEEIVAKVGPSQTVTRRTSRRSCRCCVARADSREAALRGGRDGRPRAVQSDLKGLTDAEQDSKG